LSVHGSIVIGCSVEYHFIIQYKSCIEGRERASHPNPIRGCWGSTVLSITHHLNTLLS